jgi:YfiH family protein
VNILQSRLLSGFEHGFGTRHSNLSQDTMASLKQIHSGLVLCADRDAGCVGEGDALISNWPGRLVSVRTADCLPILLADARTGAVAAIHAGWRGTVAQIAATAVACMTAEFGSRPEDLLAAIGPGIGKCCYQVGAEVARQFGESGACNLDLAEHNSRQLKKAGLMATNIDIISACTFCQPDEFFSYRREGERAGRMISYIRNRV